MQTVEDVNCSQAIRELTRMTGSNEHNVMLNKEINAESILSLFQGSLLQGNWLVLNGLHLIDQSVGGLIAQFVSDIKNAWQQDQDNVYILGNKVNYNRAFQMVYNFENLKTRDSINLIRKEMIADFGQFKCLKPDFDLYCEVMLSSIGLSKSADLAKRIATVNSLLEVQDPANRNIKIS